MTLLQQFLINGGTIDELQDKFAIVTKRHGKFKNLVLFKYDQIESPFSEKIVQECRGIILDENNNWSIVAYPFNKFFNYGEGYAANIDWSTAKVQEKIDGSLCFIYYYNDEWHVSSSGMPDAAGQINGFEDLTFASLFWKTFHQLNLSLPEDWYKHYTFIFELTSQYNRVVVRHKEPMIRLIGVRNNLTELEDSVENFVNMDYPYVKSFSLQSISEIEETFQHMDPLVQEGYVIVDSMFNRIKVKHPGYVAIHHTKDSLCPRTMLEVIRVNESTEFLTYFPEIANEFNAIAQSYRELVDIHEAKFNEIKHIENQKEFALEATKMKCSGALFAMRSGKINSVKQYLIDINIKSLMKILNLKE